MKTRLNSENTADERYDVEEEKLSSSGTVDGDLSERVCDESQPSKTKKTVVETVVKGCLHCGGIACGAVPVGGYFGIGDFDTAAFDPDCKSCCIELSECHRTFRYGATFVV